MFYVQRNKKIRLRITLTSKYNKAEVQRNAIVFVDDSFYSCCGVECEGKIQEIVN